MGNERIGAALFVGFLLGFLLLVLVIAVPAANAQTGFASCTMRPFDPICQVMGPVYRQHEEIRVRQAVENRIRQAQNAAELYGIYDYAGRAIAPAIIGATGGYRDSYGRPMGRREKVIIGAGIGAATVGGITRNWKGAAIGGGVGALAGALLAGRGGSAAAGPSAGGGRGDFELSNSMRYSIDVYRRDRKGREKHLGRLSSGDVWAVPAPKPGETYHGYVLIPNNSGGLSSDHLYPAPMQNGWVFVEPAEAVAQGGGTR